MKTRCNCTSVGFRLCSSLHHVLSRDVPDEPFVGETRDVSGFGKCCIRHRHMNQGTHSSQEELTIEPVIKRSVGNWKVGEEGREFQVHQNPE